MPSPARVPSKFRTYQNPALDHRRGRATRRWLFWLVVLALALGAWYAAPLITRRQPRDNAVSPAAAVHPARVPVVAVAAWSGDIPVSLNGLGAVTALQTVNVKSRVDGQLVNVAFREGQFVVGVTGSEIMSNTDLTTKLQQRGIISPSETIMSTLPGRIFVAQP